MQSVYFRLHFLQKNGLFYKTQFLFQKSASFVTGRYFLAIFRRGKNKLWFCPGGRILNILLFHHLPGKPSLAGFHLNDIHSLWEFLYGYRAGGVAGADGQAADLAAVQGE